MDAGEIVIYQNPSGDTQIEVKLEKESVWLHMKEITKLFARDKSLIFRHISNVFKEKELDRDSVVAKNATTGRMAKPTW